MSTENKNKRELPLIRPKQGKEQIESMFKEATKKSGFFVDGVMYDDIDKEFTNKISTDFKLIDKYDSGEVIPVTFYNIQRWAEYQSSWENVDKNKNIKLPFISVIRKPNPQQGTQRGNLWNIPGTRHYNYYRVPTFDGNREGVDIYKVPQPVPVDIEYEVKLFSYKIELLNDFNTLFIDKYKAYEYYIKPNGLFMKTVLDGIDDDSVLSDIDSRKYYVQTMKIKICGYIIDPKDFIIEKAITRTVADIYIDTKTTQYKDEPEVTGLFNKTISFLGGVNNQTLSFKATDNYIIRDITKMINIDKITSISVDGDIILTNFINGGFSLDEPIDICYGDKLIINIVKTDIISESELVFNCEK